jgi:hypothetical protein
MTEVQEHVLHPVLTLSSQIQTLKIQTPSYPRREDEDEPPQSVIHVPSGFGNFRQPYRRSVPPPGRSILSVMEEEPQRADLQDTKTESSESVTSSDATVTSLPEQNARLPTRTTTETPVPPSPAMPPTPLRTSLPPMAKDSSERDTPRAQTRKEVEAFEKRPRSSLANISEDESEFTTEDTGDEQEKVPLKPEFFRDAEAEIKQLKAALSECWTLCNTLANLSLLHRERLFNFGAPGGPPNQEQAWKACWKLCQNLYETRDDNFISYVRPTLDLCRDFCAALFEVRVRDNETADSVLRVSFELNNHLFNTHDRSLPEAFRERTLDFYITLCHRLMKQKSRLAEETDSLLRACWSLAEMLFSLRQNKREGKKPDEELLGSAVQSCWELCDLFREGWTQIRPERGTPRPSQTTFTQAFHQAKRTGFAPVVDENGNSRILPETPTTIFDDTVTISPDEAPVPNILVLGAERNAMVSTVSAVATIGKGQVSTTSAPPQANGSRRRPVSAVLPPRPRWPSSSSNLSTPASERSVSTLSSANTVTTPAEDPTLTVLKLVFIKAAMNIGFQRHSSDPAINNLQTFVKSLPETAFGMQSWQLSLLENYRKVIAGDPGFRNLGPSVRASGVDVAKAVQAMVQSGYFGWMRDLYRLVFGFYMEEALAGERRGVLIQT